MKKIFAIICLFISVAAFSQTDVNPYIDKGVAYINGSSYCKISESNDLTSVFSTISGERIFIADFSGDGGEGDTFKLTFVPSGQQLMLPINQFYKYRIVEAMVKYNLLKGGKINKDAYGAFAANFNITQ